MSAVLAQIPVRPPAIEPVLSAADLVDLVQAIAADTHRWQFRLRLPTAETAGGRGCPRNSHVDVRLLSWRPGQTTDLHDHGPSAAALTVISGQLSEIRIDQDGGPPSTTRRAGSATWLAPGVIHDVSGSGDDVAVSIHAYSPALRKMNYYAADPRGRLQITRAIRTDEPEQELPAL